jgi:capsular exopolysaccharide synthesis family protein
MRKAGESIMVAVCSPVAGDGKSVTAVNLAGALAQDPKARVLLVEIDLHRPFAAMVDYLALENPAGRGLVNVIQDPSLSLDEVIRHLPAFNLSVLPGGSHSTSLYEVLESARLGELLAEMRRRYDYVILDAPPVVPVLDCRLIEKWVDNFIIVVSAHKTPRRMLEETFSLLSPEKIMGLVFNCNDRPSTYNYGYDYAYAHGYGRPMRRRRAGRRARVIRKRIQSRSPVGTIPTAQGNGEKRGN